MSNDVDTATEASADVVRGLYDALRRGDLPGVLAKLHAEVVVDEPGVLPYGGVHQGREVFVESILGAMTGYANVAITAAEVFEGPTGVVGKLVGMLTAHSTGEEFPLTMIELHQVEGRVVRKIDVYTKNPHELAEFYERAAAGVGGPIAAR